MPEIEATRELSRSEVAEYLRAFADQLDQHQSTKTGAPSRQSSTAESTTRNVDDAVHTSDDRTETQRTAGEGTADSGRLGKVTFLVGKDSATVVPPEMVQFDVSIDDDSSLMDSETRRYVDFSLSWLEADVPEDDEFSIE
ncbi:hypothetical protein [Haloarchaeobius sp. DFWS5]|uniref:hypothetical protein n=1 Tax=Haloarchaeobius sp. DFWS5 TaxID=3446114 RepID=UPI003EBC22C2